MNTHSINTCFIAVVFCLASQWWLPAVAQQSIHQLSPAYSGLHHEGEALLLEGKSKDALRNFNKVLRKYPGFAPAWRSSGFCHQLMGDHPAAAADFERAVAANPWHSKVLYFECGQAFFQSGQYEKALTHFTAFDSLRQLSPHLFSYNGVEEMELEKQYTARLDGYFRSCHQAQDRESFSKIEKVENIGRPINTGADEYFPCLVDDGAAILYTSRAHAFSDENLFLSLRNGHHWSTPQPIAALNSDENEGMSTIARNGHLLLFTACQRPGVRGTCDLWEARLDGTDVSELRPAPGSINSDEWESQASLSCDGSTLYFASMRPGGYGGADVWASERKPDGTWGDPYNPGPNINTPGDEEAPFITADGQTLFFSSTGHPGYGEADILFSRRNADGTWSEPINPGPPVNTCYRELGFFISLDGSKGWFASNRPGGHGGMDIYRFRLPQELYTEPLTFVKGQIIDKVTRQPIGQPPAVISLDKHPPIFPDQYGEFYICLKARQDVEGTVEAQGYHPGCLSLQGPAPAISPPLPLTIELEPVFNLLLYARQLEPKGSDRTPSASIAESFLFDFDKSAITGLMEQRIDRFMEETLRVHRVIGVHVIGYADDVGGDTYNQRLSEARAHNVAQYLENKGVKVQEVNVEGRGAVPAATEGQSASQNRKVEVIVNIEE